MTVLVLFATIEGQTGKIARFVAEVAEKDGNDVKLIDLSKKRASVSFDEVDKVILAASVHERRHPKPFEIFLDASRDELAPLHTLLISVSLSAAFPEGMAEASEYLTEMKMRTGFTPDEEMLVAGAIKTGKYDYFASQVVRHVVLRDRDYDSAAGEHEFTDWDALAGKVSGFLARKVTAA